MEETRIMNNGVTSETKIEENGVNEMEEIKEIREMSFEELVKYYGNVYVESKKEFWEFVLDIEMEILDKTIYSPKEIIKKIKEDIDMNKPKQKTPLECWLDCIKDTTFYTKVDKFIELMNATNLCTQDLYIFSQLEFELEDFSDREDFNFSGYDREEIFDIIMQKAQDIMFNDLKELYNIIKNTIEEYYEENYATKQVKAIVRFCIDKEIELEIPRGEDEEDYIRDLFYNGYLEVDYFRVGDMYDYDTDFEILDCNCND